MQTFAFHQQTSHCTKKISDELDGSSEILYRPGVQSLQQNLYCFITKKLITN